MAESRVEMQSEFSSPAVTPGTLKTAERLGGGKPPPAPRPSPATAHDCAHVGTRSSPSMRPRTRVGGNSVAFANRAASIELLPEAAVQIEQPQPTESAKGRASFLLRSPPRADTSPRAALSTRTHTRVRFVPTENPAVLETDWMLDRVARLAKVMTTLTPGTVAFDRLHEQHVRLTAELARRRELPVQ